MCCETATAPKEGADAPDYDWTADHVCELFDYAINGTAILFNAGTIAPAGTLHPGRPKVLNWLQRYLTASEREWIMKVYWQRHRRRHGLGLDDQDFYRQQSSGPKSVSGANRKRERLCLKVALLLKRDCIPRFRL